MVVPKGTPQIKCDAIRGYGAELVFCENSPTSRKETCEKISKETGKHIVHPYDDYDILAGQVKMIKNNNGLTFILYNYKRCINQLYSIVYYILK